MITCVHLTFLCFAIPGTSRELLCLCVLLVCVQKNSVAVDQSQVEAAMMGEGEAACEVLTAIYDLITSSTPNE